MLTITKSLQTLLTLICLLKLGVSQTFSENENILNNYENNEYFFPNILETYENNFFSSYILNYQIISQFFKKDNFFCQKF